MRLPCFASAGRASRGRPSSPFPGMPDRPSAAGRLRPGAANRARAGARRRARRRRLRRSRSCARPRWCRHATRTRLADPDGDHQQHNRRQEAGLKVGGANRSGRRRCMDAIRRMGAHRVCMAAMRRQLTERDSPCARDGHPVSRRRLRLPIVAWHGQAAISSTRRQRPEDAACRELGVSDSERKHACRGRQLSRQPRSVGAASSISSPCASAQGNGLLRSSRKCARRRRRSASERFHLGPPGARRQSGCQPALIRRLRIAGGDHRCPSVLSSQNRPRCSHVAAR